MRLRWCTSCSHHQGLAAHAGQLHPSLRRQSGKSQAQYRREALRLRPAERTFDSDLNFLSRWSGPLGLLVARDARLYLHRQRASGRSGYAASPTAGVAHGRLLPLVILTELGGGLFVLFGLKTRWAALALRGFCLLTALFFHSGAEQALQLQKNVAMAGGFLALALAGPGAWSLDGLARSRRAGDQRCAVAAPSGSKRPDLLILGLRLGGSLRLAAASERSL